MVRLSVPKMHCAKCKASVEQALKPIEGTRYVTVDLDQKHVVVGGSPSVEDVISALDRIGFPASVVAA